MFDPPLHHQLLQQCFFRLRCQDNCFLRWTNGRPQHWASDVLYSGYLWFSSNLTLDTMIHQIEAGIARFN